MEKLNLDTGVVTYRIPGCGTLRFNPADPNLYGRFYEAQEKFAVLEQEMLSAQGDTVALMGMADQKLKALLGWMLGGDNDLDKALGGVSLLAVCGNGHTLAANLMAALQKILEEGAARLAEAKAASL